MSEKSQRILIVDDNEDILSNLADILHEFGYETETARDGMVALEKLEQSAAGDEGRFDLCLLDFKMPGMDGAELLQRIRVRNPEIRAIMITAYAGEDGVQRALEAGTRDVLRKPVDIPQLLGLISNATAS